jgi:hypothetical protein
MKRLIMLAAGLAFAASAPAMAGGLYRPPVYAAHVQPDSKSTGQGGIIEANGTIAYGSGFTVAHPETGEYEINFGSGKFKKCPVISVTPAGGTAPIPNLYYYDCGSGGVQITVLIENYAGTLEDNAFHFTAVEP